MNRKHGSVRVALHTTGNTKLQNAGASIQLRQDCMSTWFLPQGSANVFWRMLCTTSHQKDKCKVSLSWGRNQSSSTKLQLLCLRFLPILCSQQFHRNSLPPALHVASPLGGSETSILEGAFQRPRSHIVRLACFKQAIALLRATCERVIS